MMTLGSNLRSASTPAIQKNSAFSEATESLMVLGYDKSTVISVLNGINPDTKDVGEVIKLALKKLAR